MPSLLHVSASPRGAESESLAIARTFLDTLQDTRPDVTVDTFDLWDGSLPQFGPAAAAAKMSVFAGHLVTPAFKNFRASMRVRLIRRLIFAIDSTR